MYKLLKIQHNYSKKQIFIITNQEITETIKKNQVIYKTRYSRKILQMKTEKIKTVIKLHTLKYNKNIHTCQKLTENYQKFITNFINIIASHINLLRKNKSFKKTESQKQALQKIKEKFKEKSILI